MDKREIRIRLCDTRTGEILNENVFTNFYNLRFIRDRQVLYRFLDDFIERLRNESEVVTLSLEFQVVNDYIQGKLPF